MDKFAPRTPPTSKPALDFYDKAYRVANDEEMQRLPSFKLL
jgi:hypothetical protein